MLLLELFSGKECIELFVFGVFGATNTSITIAIACQGAWVLLFYFCPGNSIPNLVIGMVVVAPVLLLRLQTPLTSLR